MSPSGTTPTALIAMGSEALMEGFAIAGFETWPEATVEDLAQVLQDLLNRQATALVLLESEFAQCDLNLLARVKAEGGRIVVVEIPALQNPSDYHLQVEQLVRATLGSSVLSS